MTALDIFPVRTRVRSPQPQPTPTTQAVPEAAIPHAKCSTAYMVTRMMDGLSITLGRVVGTPNHERLAYLRTKLGWRPLGKFKDATSAFDAIVGTFDKETTVSPKRRRARRT